MIHQLQPATYHRVEQLYTPLGYQALGMAVLRGHRGGCVLADHPESPQAAFIFSPPAWCFLVGRSDNDGFNDGLGRALQAGQVAPGMENALLTCHPDGWESRLPHILGARPVPFSRHRYACSSPSYHWQDHVPQGYGIHPLTRELLAEPHLEIPRQVTAWMQEWGSLEAFLEGGLGVVAIRDCQVVAWCLADAVVDGVVEVGSHTLESHGQQNLAAAVTAALVEIALEEKGLVQVAWHCDADDTASVSAALQAGFVLDRQYTQWVAALDPERHASLIKGLMERWRKEAGRAFAQERYVESARLLERIVRVQEKAHQGPYRVLAARAWAAAGEQERAFAHLEAAVGLGWRDPVAFLAAEFGPLRETDRWRALLVKLADRAWDTVANQYDESGKWPPSI